MSKRILVILLAFMAFTCVVHAQALATASTWVANPSELAQSKDAMVGYPAQPFAFGTSSITTLTASTTTRALTSLAGRKSMSIYVSSGTGELWVSLGTTTAVVNSGMKVTDSWENIPIDANVPVGHIASTAAFTPIFIQFGVRQGPDR